MDKELVFEVLGIKATNSEEEIRGAYRELLKQTNPEDDAEGFKRLRQAYEEALKLISEGQQERAEEDDAFKNEVDFWIDKVDGLYQDVLERRKPKLWQKLLEDPVCEGLDTSLEAREKFLIFLMDHIHLPHEIWKIIEETFDIKKDLESLQDKFPSNFLSYVRYYIDNPTFIPYEMFEYRDSYREIGNGDGYIDKYLEIKKQLDREEVEGCMQALEDLKVYYIYHPFEDVEKLRVLAMEDTCREGASLATKLLGKYPDSDYVMLHAGRILWGIGEKEKAYSLWKTILEKEPEYYLAKYFCVMHLMEKQSYYEVRELLLELLSVNGRDEELLGWIKTVNNALIEEFRAILASGKEDVRLSKEEMQYKLAWCLFQNERMEEAEKLLPTLSNDGENEYHYYHFYGQLLYRLERYEEAIPYIKRWAEMCTGLTDDGTKETQKRIKRQALAHAKLSYCYYQIGKNEEGQAEAQLAVDMAADREELLENLHYQAGQLLEIKEYEKAVDVCDRLLEEDDGYYPAYLTRQEASYHMRRAQQVIDDYYNAINIYPGYYKPYLLAAEVFFIYDQYEDAKGVIDRAKENQVEFSMKMKLYEAKILRSLATSSEERAYPREILKQLSEELHEAEHDIEDVSEVVYEQGLLCWDDDRTDEAITYIRQAIEQNPERKQYNLVCGHIYLEAQRYEEALQEYKEAEIAYEDQPILYYSRGCVYNGLDNEEASIDNFKKVLELDETYRDTNDKLYSLYRKIYRRYNSKQDFATALYYINKEIEIRENDANLFHRAVLYDDAMKMELAIKDYEKSLEYDPNDPITWSNMGFSYRAVGKYEEAIRCFQKSKELMDSADSDVRPYYQISKCYLSLGNYERAIEACKEGIEIFPNDSDFWEQLGLVYEKQGKYKDALKAYKKMKGLSTDYYSDMADVWEAMGEQEKAVQIMEEGIREVEDDKKAECYSQLGDLYNDRLEYGKAAQYYLKSATFLTEPIEIFEKKRYTARCYYMMGEYEKAKEYAREAMDSFHQAGRDEENYLAFTAYAPARYGVMGWIHLCLGNREKAEEYFCEMEKLQPCRFCDYKKCHESTLWMALLYESVGDYEKAIQLYEETLQRKPDDNHAKNALKNLRRKL